MSLPAKPQSSAHCHKKVAEVAKACAGGFYESIMGADNDIYRAWRAKHPGMGPKALERRFVARYWGDCIPMARATLARLLTSPTIDPGMKEEIMEILTLDATLIRGRQQPMQVMGSLPGGN